MHNVKLETLPATTLAACRGIVPTYSDEKQLWDAFMPAFGAATLTIAGAPGCIEHATEYTETDIDESVFFPVLPGSEAGEPLRILVFSEREVASVTVTGPFEVVIGEAHDALAKYMAAEGLKPAFVADDESTHPFNSYLTEPSVPREQAMTRVSVPVAR